MSKLDGESESKRLVRFGWYELPENNSIVRFCQDSGLHGLKYITGPSQHLFERLLWLVAVLLAAITGSALIYKTWDQYNNLPVIIVPSPKQLSIEEFSFPSVTVCSLDRVKKETYEKYHARAYQSGDVNDTNVEEAKDIVKILDALCDPINVFLKSFLGRDFKIFGMRIISAILNWELSQIFQAEIKIMKLLNESSSSCEDLIHRVSWINNYWYTFAIFEEVETDFGICCTFNSLPQLQLKPWKNISIEDMGVGNRHFYHGRPLFKNETLPEAPFLFTNTKYDELLLRQTVPGANFGLSLLIKTNGNESYCNSTHLDGFLVSISNPVNTPLMKDTSTFIDVNTEVFLTVKPKLTLADQSIKRFSAKQRGCYFNNEMMLRDYAVYTQSNCLQECVANLTMESCQTLADCWAYLTTGDWIFRHACKPRGKCIYLSDNYTEGSFATSPQVECQQCLPTCTDIKYEYNTEVKKLGDYYIESLGPGNQSIVHVYFDEYYATPNIRKEQFGILELLANSGGLLGLCLGFSGISILEIIYYFTIRVCFRRCRHKVLFKTYNGTSPDNTTTQKENVDEINLRPLAQEEVDHTDRRSHQND